MLMPWSEDFRYLTIIDGYRITRIYKTSEGETREDSYNILKTRNGGISSLCSHLFDNGEWGPAGGESYTIDFEAFEEALMEFLDVSAY